MMTIARISLLTAVVLALAIPASAYIPPPPPVDIPLLTFDESGGNYIGHGYSQTIGWEFRVNDTFNVAALYWYDPTGTNLTDRQVGIWDSLGNLVVQACVGSGCSGSTYVVGLPNPSYWETPVTATLSAVNDYVIGGYVGTADPLFANASGVTTNPLITYLQDRYYQYGPSDSGLLVPSQNYPPQEDGYFGPNLSATPEPGFYGILALGLSGLVFAVRRKRRA